MIGSELHQTVTSLLGTEMVRNRPKAMFRTMTDQKKQKSKSKQD